MTNKFWFSWTKRKYTVRVYYYFFLLLLLFIITTMWTLGPFPINRRMQVHGKMTGYFLNCRSKLASSP